MSSMVDIIFAGGGTTACVIAGRLAAAEPSLKILIVESGQHTRDLPQHTQPCRYLEHLAPNSTTVTFHVAKPSPHLNGRSVVVQCGRSIGGGSTVNFMAYVRGGASDYDDWNALGNEGWGFEDLLPFIRKLETFAPIPDRPTHGYSGPIHISAGGADLGIGKQFLKVAREYDPARPQVDDNNDFKSPNAYSPMYKYVDPATGKRSDAASGYLYPHLDSPNLTILTGKRVKRVIFEDGRAVGIEYTADTDPSKGLSSELITARARKFVVVSAGAFGTPSILERSGIGSRAILEKNNIRVLVDLPGVGENYMDHLGICLPFYAADGVGTMDDVWSDPKALAENLPEWERHGTGKVAHTGIESIMKVRPTAAQLESSGQAFRSRWESYFECKLDKPVGIMGTFSGFPLNPSYSMTTGRRLFSMMFFVAYPESTGSVHIKSGKDANSTLEFDSGYLTGASDIAQFTLLYKIARERARRMSIYRGEAAAYHPKFTSDSSVACTEMESPVPVDGPDYVYSEADNEIIAQFTRDKVSTSWHSLGTCAMKPRDQGGVVDARLSVYGVEGLKVADLSICPTNVGNNTYSTALLIGEKAAALIAEELGVILK